MANSTNSTWLSHLSDQQIADGIDGLTPEKRAQMIRKHFPGKPLPSGLSVEDALSYGSANFEVVKVPLRPVIPQAEGEFIGEAMANRVGLYRSDTWSELGSAGPNYGILQNEEAFAAADLLVGNGEMALEALQVIDGGARIRLSGLVGTSHIDQLGAGPDVLAHYAMFEANHDGIHSTMGRLYTVRLQCFNGMTSAETSGSFSVRHTSKASDRLKEAQAALVNVTTAAIEETALFQKLAQRSMSQAAFLDFANALLDSVRKPLTEDASDRQRKNRERDIDALVEFFNHGEGNHGVSEYDAYNAVTDWVTPRLEKMKTAVAFQKKFESQATGYHARTKAKALRILTR